MSINNNNNSNNHNNNKNSHTNNNNTNNNNNNNNANTNTTTNNNNTNTTNNTTTNNNFWEGQLTGSGTTFTLQSPSYFSGKTAGEYLEHGFQLGYAGDTEPTFTSISFNGVDLCSGSSASGVSEPVGSTEAPVGSTEGPGETTSGPQESTTAGPAGTSPGTGTGENCEDLIVDKNGWSGNWQVILIDIAKKYHQRWR